MSKRPKKPREKCQTRIWEQERRNRLNQCFTKLWEVLPIYDKSKPISKSDILIHATSTIKDLDEKLQKLLIDSDNDKSNEDRLKVFSDIIKKLQDRVKKLLLRNEQLANLLGNAGIKVPSECGTVKKSRKTPKYDNAISTKQATVFQQELEKENQAKRSKSGTTKSRSKGIRSKKKSKKQQLLSSTNCLFLVSQSSVPQNPCFIFSKTPTKLNPTVMTSSLLVKGLIVSPDIKPSIFPSHPQLTGLSRGTLVLADGTVLPAVQNPPVLPTIITNPVPSHVPAIIVVSSADNANSSCASKITATANMSLSGNFNTPAVLTKAPSKNRLPVLRARPNITKTTQVNKVPIPALSSKYNRHVCLDNKKNQVGAQRKKESKVFTESTTRAGLSKKKEAKTPNEIATKNSKPKSGSVDENKSTGDVELQSVEKPIQLLNQENSDNIRQPTTVSNSQISESINTVLKNQISTSIQDAPTKINDDDNRKIVKSHEITNFISEANTTKRAKLDLELEKNDSDILAPSCSKNYNNLERFGNVTNAKPNIESAKPVSLSKQINIDLNVSTQSDKSVASCIGTPVNNNPVITSKPLPRSNDSINSKCFDNIHLEHKSSAAACLKQVPKPFEETNLQTQHSNLPDFKSLEMNLSQAELSNDIFATFNVPPGCQNPESTSPTAAFLLAFPLVSSGTKVAEVMGDENSESQTGTPNLLQIGTMDISKPTQSYSDSLTPNMLGFDSFSFFNNKENCGGGGYYNNFAPINTTCQSNISSVVTPKTVNSFVNGTGIMHLNALDSGLKNNQSKSIATNIQYNKSEIMSNKPSTNNKIEVNAKDSVHNKFPNYHNNIVGACVTQSAKEHSVNSLAAQNIEKTVATTISQRNTNVLEINNDIFSFKSISNENYLQNTSKQNTSSNSAAPMYTAKPASSSYYSNYKNYNSSINSQFVESKHHPPVYTSAGITNTFYNAFGTDGESRNFATNYNEYPDYNRKHFTNSCVANPQIYQKEKPNPNTQPKIKPPQNKPINWMTTPSTTASYKSDYFLPPFSKEPAFNPNLSSSTIPSNSYFNSSNDYLNMNQDIRKSSDMSLPTYSSYQRTEPEENQFSWSPNKMPQFLETTHAHSFVSSTLPTLVGDLALNNTPVIEQKNAKDRNRDNRRKAGNCENQQSSFLSVSQLVEPTQESVSAKVGSRRNSGSRSKSNTPKSKRTNGRSEANNKELQNYSKTDKSNFNISVATNLFNESKQQSSRNNSKHTTSSYSAEALIGNQGSGESPIKRNNSCQNKAAIVPSFFNENMISYFPSIEASQDNNYQSYQSNSFSQNFTTFQNNSYSSNNYIPSSCPITASYIPTNNFMPNSNAQDFLGENTNLFQNTNSAVSKEKCNFTKNYYRPPDKDDKNQTYSCKKAKKRPLNENVLPSFDIHFFSMPGAINSPILPDDFHTTYLPPTTLYSCKNPLYSKPNAEAIPNGLIPPLPLNKSTIQHPQMSPSVNSAGTSLTNFNLSTIFPEINKGPVQESFSGNRSKDYNPPSKSISMPSSLQVPFSNKY